MIKNEDWIPVTKGVPDKNIDSTKVEYIVTIERADGSRKTTVSDWGPVDNTIIHHLERNPAVNKYIHDGWAFGIIWRDVIDTVYNVIAWQYMPKAFIGIVDFKDEGDTE